MVGGVICCLKISGKIEYTQATLSITCELYFLSTVMAQVDIADTKQLHIVATQTTFRWFGAVYVNVAVLSGAQCIFYAL